MEISSVKTGLTEPHLEEDRDVLVGEIEPHTVARLDAGVFVLREAKPPEKGVASLGVLLKELTNLRKVLCGRRGYQHALVVILPCNRHTVQLQVGYFWAETSAVPITDQATLDVCPFDRKVYKSSCMNDLNQFHDKGSPLQITCERLTQ